MQIKRMNWFRRPPLHEQMVAFRERQRAATENFLSATSAAASNFAAVQTNLSAGLAQLTTQGVIDRTQKELKARANNADDEFSEITALLNTVA